MSLFLHWIEHIALTVEAVGVAVMVAGFLIATYRFIRHPNFYDSPHAYLAYRHGIGRSILVGLDFLIAGDLIKTVIVVNTGEQVATLAAVVLIRAFLGFTLHVEVEGHWPWQNHKFKRRDIKSSRRPYNDASQ
ncbi:DUF1622 domain-containing protein [Halomonas vilamensis]|uniref:DUF1622 domain-containing protein n=1 Tax=Vreelandella vilamensis TaxID=531309 RepID=A0ABU1GZE8_9GAMM|nr:DUF1622 domain-containing protein [Halomonas vilamensis]MDR5897421.1 DUF1622 domain-containing protein [Halomonas vilamensis]